MINWKHGNNYGQRVLTADVLDQRDFSTEAVQLRRPKTHGTVVAHSDRHGLCFEVEHDSGGRAWYDADELLELTTAAKLNHERGLPPWP